MAAIISDKSIVVKWLLLFQIMNFCKMNAIISDYHIVVKWLLLFQIMVGF